MTPDYSVFYYLDYLRHSFGTETYYPGGTALPSKVYEFIDKRRSRSHPILDLVRGKGILQTCPYCNVSLVIKQAEYHRHGSRDDVFGTKYGLNAASVTGGTYKGGVRMTLMRAI